MCDTSGDVPPPDIVMQLFEATDFNHPFILAQSRLAATEYTALIWGVLYGWVFWSDWPDSTGWLGIAIIVGAGLFVIWLERLEGLRARRV